VSQGRFPDGAASLYFMTNATPRAANDLFTPNTPPTLSQIGDRIINEGSLLAFNCIASDTNLPAQVLSFSLEAGAPTGAAIHATSGLFTWTPAEAQGPGVYSIIVRVTDNGSPSLGATQTFSVVVNEVNNAPVLAPLLSRTVSEGNLLLATNAATDPDAGAQALTFGLDPGAPEGMTIDPASGLISWTPTEAQGPGTYAVSVRVSDDAQPPLSDARQVTIFVVEVNTPPELAAIEDQTVAVGTPVNFAAAATDIDLPGQLLTFGLAGGVADGVSIDPSTGWFTWRPGPSSAGTTNQFTVTVSDHGSPPLTASRVFSIIVQSELQAVISRSDQVLLISVPSEIGRTYRLESKGSLTDVPWTPLGADTVASSASLTFTNDLSGGLQRFYRVVRMD
jgi:hypothetical protein